MYTLDTNSIIYYLKNEQKAASRIEIILARGEPIYVASITEVELFSFPKLSAEEHFRIESILRTLTTIPLDSSLARAAGSLRRHFKLEIADSIIAATALYTGSRLVTRNIKDFRRVPDLELLTI